MRLLSSVFIAPYRHPLLSAKQFMTLDHLSGGRAIVGVGAGHVEAEFEALGLDFASRGERLNECIDAMRDAFATEQTQYTGKFFDYKDMKLAPRRSSNPSDLDRRQLEARAAPRRRAGRRLDPARNPAPQMQESVDYIRAHRDKVRPGAHIDFGWLPEWIYVGKPFFEPTARHITGSPDKIAESLRYTKTLGCNVALELPQPIRRGVLRPDRRLRRNVWPSVTNGI